MSPRSRLFGRAIGLALLAFALPGRTALAQDCPISGPSSICPGGTAELCGPPAGDYVIEWTAPDGTISNESCVIATTAGTWTLRLYDPYSGWSSSCTHELVMLGESPSCSIEGPATACEGTTVTLCGPEGAAGWSWTGPGGFVSSERCIVVGTGGTYQLTIPGSTECGGSASQSCSHAVAFEPCGTVENCPRPPVFWSRPCRDEGDEAGARVGLSELGQVAACMDQRVALFDWSSDTEGLCGVMSPAHANLRTKAKRQFAGVWANVCAGEAGVATARGPSVGLDAGALVLLDGSRRTVSAWLHEAEASLAALEGASLSQGDVKRAYREIIRAGWLINHGQGIEPVCGYASRKGGVARLDGMAEDLEGDESLAAALVDEAEAPMAMTVTGPNPFSSSAAVAFTLGSGESRDVTVGVYDLSGRLVRELARGTFEPGRHEIHWDGTDRSGVRARGGVYFVIGRVGGERVDTRLTLVR